MSKLYTALTDRQLQERVNRMEIYGDEDKLRRFTFFSANASHFMPELGYHAHEAGFKQLCLHQYLSWRDQYDPLLEERVAISGWDAEFVESLKRKPGIVCTFHSGSYRLINRMLVTSGVPFSLVVNKSVMLKEAAHFQLGFEQLNQVSNHSLNIIDAEEPSSLFKMMRAVKKGHNLLVYVDGNTGTANKNENQVVVDFMAGKLSVRKGVSVLANLLKCPLYPVTCSRPSLENIIFKAHVPIASFDTHLDKDDADLFHMQSIYTHLENTIESNPFQWECWLYIHHHIFFDSLDNDLVTDAVSDFFDASLWGVFKMDGQCFILNKTSFNSYKITESVYLEWLKNRMKKVTI